MHPELDGLMRLVFELKAQTFPSDADSPPPATLEPIVTVSFTGSAGPLGDLALVRGIDPKKSKPDNPAYLWYVQSKRTRSRWAIVSGSTAEAIADAVTALN